MYHQDWCFLAVQGPDAPARRRRALPRGARTSAFMRCAESEYRRRPVIVTRSGYTGEIGYELFTYQDIARRPVARSGGRGGTVRRCSRAGSPRATSCGWRWATRCTARTCSRSSTAFEAGLSWAVALDKGAFRGREALVGSMSEGLPSRLRGLRMHERRYIPRAHYPVFLGDRVIGEVTSGSFSPLLQTGIALAYLWPGDVVDVGDRGDVDVRGRRGWPRSCDRRSWTGARARPESSRPRARSPRRRPARTGRCERAGRAPGATPGPSPWRP